MNKLISRLREQLWFSQICRKIYNDWLHFKKLQKEIESAFGKELLNKNARLERKVHFAWFFFFSLALSSKYYSSVYCFYNLNTRTLNDVTVEIPSDSLWYCLRIWSHLLKKSLMENFIFCTVWHPSPKSALLLKGARVDSLPLFEL